MSDLQENNQIDEIGDEELSLVFGGINPQPLPLAMKSRPDNGYRIPVSRFFD